MTVYEVLSTKYGVTMSMKDVAEVLHMRHRSVLDAVSQERFPIHTYKVGRGRIADTADVAEYLATRKAAA